jgi:hypothetical protein
MADNVNSFQRFTRRASEPGILIPGDTCCVPPPGPLDSFSCTRNQSASGWVISVGDWPRRIRNLPQLSGVAQRKKASHSLRATTFTITTLSRRPHERSPPVFWGRLCTSSSSQRYWGARRRAIELARLSVVEWTPRKGSRSPIFNGIGEAVNTVPDVRHPAHRKEPNKLI